MNETFQNLPNEIDPEILKQILKDRKAMIATTRRSFFYFFYIYFGHHIRCPIAPFHFEMFRIAQDERIKRAGVMTFRNSAKSTILNMAYVLWAIMGTPQKKHVVIASQTQQRSKDHLMNIRKECEGSNQLLSENLGPFSVGEDRWGATTLIIPDYKARISAISVEEGIRGLKEGPYRPSLIIADDIEDSNSVKARESRDKTFNWFTGELIPLGETDVKVIVLGNFLNPDSVLSRLEEMIKEGKMKGGFLRVPLVDEKNNIAWPGKFPSLEAVEEFKQSIGNEITWQRDFLLRAIPDEYQIIYPDWIHKYDVLPKKDFHSICIGVDLAISQRDTADFTAMVIGKIYGYGEDAKIYIDPLFINKRLTFPETVEQCISLNKFFREKGRPQFLIEDVAYQRSLPQQLEQKGLYVKAVKVGSQDKRSRLALTSSWIRSGKILFPSKGAESLIQQLVGFGAEKHDDLADAFTILILDVISDNRGEFRIRIISAGSPDPFMPLLGDRWSPFSD